MIPCPVYKRIRETLLHEIVPFLRSLAFAPRVLRFFRSRIYRVPLTARLIPSRPHWSAIVTAGKTQTEPGAVLACSARRHPVRPEISRRNPGRRMTTPKNAELPFKGGSDFRAFELSGQLSLAASCVLPLKSSSVGAAAPRPLRYQRDHSPPAQNQGRADPYSSLDHSRRLPGYPMLADG